MKLLHLGWQLSQAKEDSELKYPVSLPVLVECLSVKVEIMVDSDPFQLESLPYP